jgi:transglutaminase-like putative cysteine protease
MKIIEQLGLMKAMGGRTIPLISKIFSFRLIHPKIFDQWKESPEDYDPKPNYEIPKYEEWMKIPDFDKEEEYLRPTLGCECDAPEIVALAYKLGVDKLSDWDYAENALKWVKNNIKFNIGGGTARETLREGMGVCIQNMTLFITLCRIRGLKARYKVMVSSELDPRMQEFGIEIYKEMSVNQIFGDFLYKALNAFPGHILAEVYIDGRWINADPTFSDELEVGLGYEVSKLGYEPEWASETGKIYYLEDSPRLGRPLLKWGKSFHRLQYMINKGFESYAEKGREILKLGEERYEKKMKKGYEGLSKELSDIIKRVL